LKLVRTTFFSAIITFIRIVSGFVASKVVALFTGPAGVALIGAFTNFIAIVLTLANGAINTGVVKYTSEYGDEEPKLKSLFSTALKISIICSAIVGLILITLAPYCSLWIFTKSEYTNIIRVLGVTIIFYSLNSLLISILNGRGQINTYTIVNTIGSVIGLLFTITLVYFFKINGALYALVLAQSIVFFVTAALVINSPWFSWGYFNQAFNKVIALKLSHFSFMAIVSALVVPVSQIVLRNMVIAKLGINNAGYWQGVMRISDGYLMLIITSLSTYYLPKLSSLKTNGELKKEIFQAYKYFLPVVLAGCIVIYFLRFFIIKILYTPNFLAMDSLFLWQLIGDFFKMAAWILAYLMIAKAMTKTFIISEITFSICYVLWGYVMVGRYGLKGITMAFAINYFIYFLVMVIIFRKIIFINHKTSDEKDG
jgi:O-antigen/teichoic acid export membrane protein